jgi:hypothetical protein
MGGFGLGQRGDIKGDISAVINVLINVWLLIQPVLIVAEK